MFNSLNGILSGQKPGFLYLTTSGVEWELETSSFTQRALSGASEIRVFTYLYHREDQMRLYGFADEQERRVFLELLKVSGIGPRAALKLLSATSANRLITLLESEDVNELSKLPGIGKKTAQKVILTLRGSLVSEETDESPLSDEILDSLVEMGFERAGASRVVSRLLAEHAGKDSGEQEREVFRRAIVELSGEGT
jgi:Holliday junction DNA helicase RuvA